MQLPIVFLCLLSLFGKLAISAEAAQQLCATQMGTKPVNSVPTRTYALTLTFTKNVKVTSTPVTTVTPAAVTTTVPTTVFTTETTTGPTSTDTTTTTLTNTATSTITSTTTATATSTSTTTTTSSGTYTVPTPAGFTAIQANPDYVPKIKAREALGLAARAAAPQQIVAKLVNGKPVVAPKLYPTSVVCGRLVETVTTKTTTVTATNTNTITASTPTSTATTTITSTSTSTIIPDRVTATATDTTSTTVTTSTVTTASTTTTVTATESTFVPTATTYAACSANNLVVRANSGKTINEVDGGDNNRADFVNAGSTYECCVACFTSTGNCIGYAYLGIPGFQCELLQSNTCQPGTSPGGVQFRTSPSDTSAGIPLGNGKCGVGLPRSSTTSTTSRTSAPPGPTLPRAQRGLPTRRRIPNVAHTIAVSSAKGGVGKSTVAVNLALAFARLGLRSGILDTDIFGPSVPRMVGLEGQQEPRVGNDNKLIPLTSHGIKSMSMGYLLPTTTAPVVWRGLMVMKALQQLLHEVDWTSSTTGQGGGGLDILVLDLPPGTGDTQLTITQQIELSGAVIVSTPQDVALSDAVKGVEMFRKVGVGILGLVQNMSVFKCPGCGEETHVFGKEGVRRWGEGNGVDLLGDVRLDGKICEDSDRGFPTVVSEGVDGERARVFMDMADGIGRKIGLKKP